MILKPTGDWLESEMLQRRRQAEQERVGMHHYEGREAQGYAEGWRDAEELVRDWLVAARDAGKLDDQA